MNTLVALFLNDEGTLTCEQMSREQLELRFQYRKGGQMDYCLSSEVTFLKNVPEQWKAHDMLILQSKDGLTTLLRQLRDNDHPINRMVIPGK
mgnify:CR=1 FL=1